MGRCAFLSFRLGGSDGVSIVAEQWRRAFEHLGWDTVTVAGDGPVDRRVAGLEIGAAEPPRASELAAALDDVDLVVVENLLTIPMHLPASRVAATVLAGRPALLHHHDPPWQRERFAHVDELPVTDPAWRHVVINERTRAEFAARGIEATTVYNGFDTEAPPGDRRATRAMLGVGDHELLIVHPVRAIARKNIGAAVALAQAVGATYWLTGPAEEDFAPELERILATAGTRVLHRPCARQADLYAACDLVVFPSIWEGFGNPPVEAAIARRPVLVGEYPVADELRALGFDWPRFVAVDDATVAEARRWLIDPDRARIEHNHEVAKQELGLGVMSRRLQSVLEQAGWRP